MNQNEKRPLTEEQGTQIIKLLTQIRDAQVGPHGYYYGLDGKLLPIPGSPADVQKSSRGGLV